MSDGNHLYAHQEQEPDGRWGIIGAMIPAMPGEPLAAAHAKTSGRPVRLAHFTLSVSRSV